MNTQTSNILGMGIYTLPEAFLYSGVPTHKLSRWIFGTVNCDPVIESQLGQENLICFLDLVQAMAINEARKMGISLPKIRKAIQFAKSEYGVQFPLVHKHKLLYFDRNLFIQLPNRTIVQATGDQGQTLMRTIVEPYMQNLHFDDDGIAAYMIPFKRYKRHIVLDPRRQFGQPLVENTGYRADVLYGAYRAEGSFDLVANAFNVDIKDVKIAVEYMDSRKKAA